MRTRGRRYNLYSRIAAILVKKGFLNEAIEVLEEGKRLATDGGMQTQ